MQKYHDTMFGITKSGSGNQYIVRLHYVDGKPVIYKTFKIADFGTELEAIRASKRFRDAMVKELRSQGIIIGTRKKRVFTKPLANSKSKILGVTRTHQRSGGSAIPDLYVWQAAWVCDDGKKGYASFAEAKYGAKNARKMACLSRKLKVNIRDLKFEKLKRLIANDDNDTDGSVISALHKLLG